MSTLSALSFCYNPYSIILKDTNLKLEMELKSIDKAKEDAREDVFDEFGVRCTEFASAEVLQYRSYDDVADEPEGLEIWATCGLTRVRLLILQPSSHLI